MGLILTIVLIFLAIGCDGGGASSPNYFSGKKPSSRHFFDESDSVFDQYGNEHLIDDDGYCDECDDYHDDWY